MRRIHLIIALLVLASMPLQALAQPVRTLSIERGQLLVDGKPLPPGALPADIDLRGLEGTFTFWGNVPPVVQIQNRLFIVTSDGLEEIGSASFEPSTFTMQQHGHGEQRRAAVPLTVHVGMPRSGGAQPARQDAALPEVVVMQELSQELQRHARGAEQLRDALQSHVDEEYVRRMEQHARALQEQAAAAGELVEELPELKTRHYIERLQDHNRQLYERIMEERRMEAETYRLAAEAAAASADESREAHLQELREKLRRIFELKQDNRRREIEQLEKRLEGLKERLEKRERLREQIIQGRIDELVESTGR